MKSCSRVLRHVATTRESHREKSQGHDTWDMIYVYICGTRPKLVAFEVDLLANYRPPPRLPYPPSLLLPSIHPSVPYRPLSASTASQRLSRPPRRDPSFSPPQRLLIHPHALFTPPARPLTQTSRNARPFAFRNDFNVITHFANSLKPRFPPLPSFLLGAHTLSLPSPSCLPSSSVQDTSLRFSTPLSLLLRLTQPLRRRQSAFLPFPPTPWPARPSIRRALHAYASAFASSSSPPGPPQHKHPHAGGAQTRQNQEY